MPNPDPQSDSLTELVSFVNAQREHLPPLPEKLVVPTKVYCLESTPEMQQRTAERAELRRKAELHERFINLVQAAGQRYKDCTLQNYKTQHPKQKQVLAEVLAYIAADTQRNLLLTGTVGTGKDHLAFAVCREAIRAGKTVRWLYGQEWFYSIRDAMDSKKTEKEIFDEVSRPDLVCLSDPLPSMGNLTPHQANMVFLLGHYRYKRGVPLIVTANVNNNQEGDDRFSEPTWDRLRDGALQLWCKWPSYRTPMREA